MEILRSVLVGNDAGTHTVTSADTIERLVERVNSSTLLEDRRDACRALRSMSKKFRLEVGAQGLNALINVLRTDQSDSEIISYVLETLSNIFSPEEFDEEVIPENQRDDFTGVGEGFSEMFLKDEENLTLLLTFLEEFDFKIRRPTLAALNFLLSNCPRMIQQQILNSHTGVSKLMDVLGETREVLRNDSLILLFKLTKGNSNIQKIVAFENAFDKLMEIMEFEGWTDGGIVVEDCLRLMLNLLRNNPSNQTFFKEGSYIARLLPSLTDSDEVTEYGWDAQKVSNMLHILQLIRTLVSPSNPHQITMACQLACKQGGVLSHLEDILLASGIPADVLTEAINTISELIRGNNENQSQFINVAAPSDPPRPILVLLLMSMVNEKQPFSLRCSVLYCVQSFLHKNTGGQAMMVESLLPREDMIDVSCGQLICGGLFSNDSVSNWLCAVALSQVVSGSPKLKEELLRVQLATQGGSGPVSLLNQCVTLLQHNASISARLGILQMLCEWVTECPLAVSILLQMDGAVAFFMAQICSNEHDETERLGHGICAFLLGLCIIYNKNTVPGSTQEELISLVEKRVGADQFLDKIADIPKHESFNKALKSPQLRCNNISELTVDNHFCALFRSLDRDVTNIIGNRRSAVLLNGTGPLDASTHAALENYKVFIRDQDTKMKEYIDANKVLHTEYTSLQARYEELTGVIQQIKDQNAILQAQVMNAATSSKPFTPMDPRMNGPSQTDAEVEGLRKQLQQQDEYIQELESRLGAEETPDTGANLYQPFIQDTPKPIIKDCQCQTDSFPDNKAITIQMLRSQLDTMRCQVMKKDEELLKLKNDLPLNPGSPRDRFENMFMTTMELEAHNKVENTYEIDLKEREIVRMKTAHEEELNELKKERDMIEVELFKSRHDLEDLREVQHYTSPDVVDGLERKVRELTAELEEYKERRDVELVNMSSQQQLDQDLFTNLKEDLKLYKEKMETEREKVEGLQSEQEDLLVMLADQEEKMVKYKTRLRDLNVEVSEDEAEDEDLT